MTHGQVNSSQEVHGLALRVISVALLITDLTKAVTFASEMPTANYEVIPCLGGSALAWPLHFVTSKATSGFTLNMASGLAGTRKFLIVQTS